MKLTKQLTKILDDADQKMVSDQLVISELKAQLEKSIADLTVVSADRDEKLTEINLLKARIAELEAGSEHPKGWKPLYISDLTSDDGWEKQTGTQSNDNSRNLPKNAVFGPDGLTIFGRRESGYNRPYTTADVLGKHISVPNYFRAEVDAILPTTFGMWPAALWLRPLTGPNPSDGEIDVNETWTGSWNGKPTFGVALHPAYGSGLGHVNFKFEYSKLPNPDPAAKHTYVVEKTKGKIRFLCDGILVKEWTSASPSWFNSIFEVEKTWYPRITLQIGGTGSPFDPPSEWRESKMVISGLRIYEPEEL